MDILFQAEMHRSFVRRSHGLDGMGPPSPHVEWSPEKCSFINHSVIITDHLHWARSVLWVGKKIPVLKEFTAYWLLTKPQQLVKAKFQSILFLIKGKNDHTNN